MIISRFIHVAADGVISFFSTTSSLSIHVDEPLGYFYALVIVNSTAMNTGVHVSSRIGVFVFCKHSFLT